MFGKKYFNYLIVYTIHYMDRVKSKEMSIKATGRLIKSIKGGIKSSADLVSVEAEIRAHFVRTYPTLTECYITNYQVIGRTCEKETVDILDRVELLSKEQILVTLGKFVDGYKSGKDIPLDRTDEQVLDILDALTPKKDAVN